MLQGRLTGRVSVALGLAPHAGLPSSSPTALENRRQTTKEPRGPCNPAGPHAARLPSLGLGFPGGTRQA